MSIVDLGFFSVARDSNGRVVSPSPQTLRRIRSEKNFVIRQLQTDSDSDFEMDDTVDELRTTPSSGFACQSCWRLHQWLRLKFLHTSYAVASASPDSVLVNNLYRFD